ncbi:hypothetical protein LRA02_17570 [Lentilactobacillus rapi]|uniref:Uncharacterized protein n=1 Tax=Lentilactobacillus rapi TaxID=481723 RepID=A0A512PNW9_9LACO|nr:hypothetical protein LRA02_17570 [Lentilactobacillus rapi]
MAIKTGPGSQERTPPFMGRLSLNLLGGIRLNDYNEIIKKTSRSIPFEVQLTSNWNGSVFVIF